MNIKNNIVNYLCDNDFVISIYDKFLYVYKYVYLGSFNDQNIEIRLKDRILYVKGKDISIIKITKQEILLKGQIKLVEMKMLNE